MPSANSALVVLLAGALAACGPLTMDGPGSLHPRAPPPASDIQIRREGGVDILSSSDGAVAMVDRTGKGAVLCMWSLYVAAQELGRRCFAGQDPDFQAELARSIARTEDFIVKNSSSPTTLADLQARKASEAAGAADDLRPEKLCKSEWPQLYTNFKSAGAAGLRAGTDELLSVPREPVINPCI